MRAKRFRPRPRALDEFLRTRAKQAGLDVSNGVERSGFVPTLRRVLIASDPGYKDHSAHPGDFATQIAWVAYHFIAPWDGFHRPDGFAVKSIIVEAVDGPYMSSAVRISLWSEADTSTTVSRPPIELDRFRLPGGKPTSYEEARWVLDNLFDIVAEEANRLLPYVQLLGDAVRLGGDSF